MPFEEFKCDTQSDVPGALRRLADALEHGWVICHSYDIAGGHPSQPNQVELTLYLKQKVDVNGMA